MRRRSRQLPQSVHLDPHLVKGGECGGVTPGRLTRLGDGLLGEGDGLLGQFIFGHDSGQNCAALARAQSTRTPGALAAVNAAGASRPNITTPPPPARTTAYPLPFNGKTGHGPPLPQGRPQGRSTGRHERPRPGQGAGRLEWREWREWRVQNLPFLFSRPWETGLLKARLTPAQRRVNLPPSEWPADITDDDTLCELLELNSS